MRIVYISLIACLISLSAFSQVIFYEDFDGISGSQAGGAGTYSFPSGWLLRNVDNGTPAANVSYVNEAWERREDFSFNVADSAAFSTSWNTSAGTVDDWMWTPAITLSSDCVLSWNAVVYDPAYPDGYEVRIMVSPDVPTGSTGDMGNQVANSTVVFSTANEATAWTSHSVDLNSYAGQTVYIAFRNNSTNMFLLLIDDVKVEQILNYDASVQSIDALSEYTQIPLGQVTALPLQAEISNNGLSDLTGVTLHVDVYNSSDEQVYSAVSDAVSLAPAATTSLNVTSFLPDYADSFQFVYYVTTNEADSESSNDSLTTSVIVTDTVYARDNSIVIGLLGIGAGNGGYIGQMFEITTADTLTSVSMYFTTAYAGEPYAAVVWDMLSDVPNQIVASSDTLYFVDNSAGLYTVPMSDFTFLQPGKYTVTAIEFDSTLTLATAGEIYTPGTTWINWPTSPSGTWANAESFGSGFAHSYILRANFGSLCNTAYYSQDISICYGESFTVGTNVYSETGTYTDVFPNGYCDSIVETNLTVFSEIVPLCTVSTDQTVITADIIENATYQWINCADNTEISGQTDRIFNVSTAGNYAVIVSVGSCSDTSDCFFADPVINGVDEMMLEKNGFIVFPVPADEFLNIYSSEEGHFEIINSLGQKISEFDVKAGQNKQIITMDFVSGWYLVINKQTDSKQRILIK